MRSTLLALCLLLAPAAVRADNFPYVNKGPVILGVKQTEAWVTWYTAHHEGTSTAGNDCWIDSQLGTPNGNIPTLTLQVPGSATPKTFPAPACDRYHAVHLTNLTPDTAYTFSLDMPYVSGGANASGRFSTPPASTAGTVHFVIYGDNRDEPITSTSTRPAHQAVVDAIVAREPGAAFLVNTGDLALNIVAVSGDDNGYTGFFAVENPLLSTRPVAVTYGNHESLDSTFYDRLFNEGMLKTGAPQYYFSFDWGPVHVAVLNSFEGAFGVSGHAPALSDAQAQWLDSDLAAAQAKGLEIFVVSHQNAYSHGDSSSHGGSPDVQAKVVPLLIKYGALGIAGGHDHYYQRGREGCVGYLVVGGGGAPMYSPDSTAPGVIAASQTHSYLAITASASGATGVAYDTQGNIIDRFDFVPAGCGRQDAGVAADAALQPGPDGATVEDASSASSDSDAATAEDASTANADAAEVNDGGKPVASADASSLKAPAGGCGCSASGSAVGGLMGLALLAVVAGRRRS